MTADKNLETENEGNISPKRKLSDTESETVQAEKRIKSSNENEDGEQINDAPHTENTGEQNGQMKIGTNSTGQSPIKVYAGCKICDKQFNGPQTYMAHLSSTGHKKKVGVQIDPAKTSVVEMFKCQICNKTFSGPIPYEQHMISKVHKKNVILIDLNKKFKDAKGKSYDAINHPKLNTEDDTTEVDKQLSCEICNKKFSGLIPYDLHISSSSHANKVNALLFDKSALKNQPELLLKDDTAQLINQWFCEICNKRFTGPIPHDIHISSAAHAKKVNACLLEKATSRNPPCINDSETKADLPAEEDLPTDE